MKKNLDVVHRAWKRLLLALLWTRKGGALRRKLVMELRLMPKYFKCLGHKTTPLTQTYYCERDCEREFSFDKTPIFHVKMDRASCSVRFHLPNIPCINPQVDFDDDQDVEYDNRMGSGRHDEEYHYGYQEQEEAEIDERADEFIAKFYQNLKLQRQISYLRCNEMLG